MPTEQIHQPRRRHLPAAVFIAIAAGLGIVVALLPRTGDQAPPPTVAEFAPQAAREIKNTAADQSSRFGTGEVPCGNGQTCDESGKPIERPTIKVPLVKQCFGTPPRQSPDPQSPPCIPYWDGPPAKPTVAGVSANEIVVALPTYAFENATEVQYLADYFNKQFQLYGRKIRLSVFNARGGLYTQPDPKDEIADAKDVQEKIGAFASLSTGGRYGSEHLYYDQLAREHILSVAHRAGTKTTEAYLDRFAPYRWSVVPGLDTMQRHMADFVCSVLAGKAPIYAGPGITEPKRIFGLVYERAADGSVPNLDDFRHRVKSECGEDLSGRDFEDVENGDPTRNGTSTVLKLIQAHVTSVICFCDVADVRGSLMQNASGQQYRPEWIVSTYIDGDVDNSFQQGPPDQSGHVIGVSFRNKWLPREYMPWYWAITSAHPDYAVAPANSYNLAARYSSLLLLASGIQTAGPALTAQTFEAGLQRTDFPNPGAEGPPYYQAWVGFPGGAHTMMHDATMYWYSPSDRGTVDQTNVGAVCYVAGGRRYDVGAWRKQQPAFYGTCRP